MCKSQIQPFMPINSPVPARKKSGHKLNLRSTQMSSQLFICNVSCNWEGCHESKAAEMHQFRGALVQVPGVGLWGAASRAHSWSAHLWLHWEAPSHPGKSRHQQPAQVKTATPKTPKCVSFPQRKGLLRYQQSLSDKGSHLNFILDLWFLKFTKCRINEYVNT